MLDTIVRCLGGNRQTKWTRTDDKQIRIYCFSEDLLVR
jgi:hypothetical protein